MSTIRDVAKEAGVSAMTVSRYFNEPDKLRPGTRSKVEKAIKNNNYVPNATARSLVSGRTHSISLVVSDITNPFFTEIARSVEDSLNNFGFTLIIGNSDETPEKESKYIQTLVSQRVDGLIISPSRTDLRHIKLLQQHNIPVVLIDRKIPNADVDSVVSDSFDAGYRLAKHLIERGYQDIVFVGGKRGLSTLEERLAGYLKVLDESNLRASYHLGEYSQRSGSEIVNNIIDEGAIPEAIITANNFVAIGAIRSLNEHNLLIPEDVALACFGDLESASTIHPFLTVIDHCAYDMGREAARMLVERINGYSGKARTSTLPVELIVRKSTPVYER